MVEEQVVGMAGVHQLAVVAGHRLEPVIGGFDENLRFVAGRAEHALDAEHFMADGVAVAERRQHLVDPASRSHLPAGPLRQLGQHVLPRPADPGAADRTSRAADRSPAAGVSFFSRSNMSRYFRSITGQS